MSLNYVVCVLDETMTRLLAVILFGLLLVFPTAAQDADIQPITLHVVATIGDDPALCGNDYAGVGADAATIHFGDFRFYLSNIHLLTAAGDAVPLELAQDGLWQHDNVVLLDFEDGSATCSEIGNAALNGQIIGSAPTGDYAGLRFDLGVPFALNHADVTLAPSPLNIAALWWNWQGGYKFMRVDIATDAGANNAWNLHLGSTGCASAAAVMAPDEPCTRPNIPTVTLPDFDPETDVIVADLGALLAEVALYDSTPMPPGCMSGLDDPDCPPLFAGFGLDVETGACVDDECSTQAFFRTAAQADVTLVGR